MEVSSIKERNFQLLIKYKRPAFSFQHQNNYIYTFRYKNQFKSYREMSMSIKSNQMIVIATLMRIPCLPQQSGLPSGQAGILYL